MEPFYRGFTWFAMNSTENPTENPTENKVFPASDYKRFMPVFSVLAQLKPGRNKTARHIESDHEALFKLYETLADLGFRRLHPEDSRGRNGLVFEGGEHQMLRIVRTERAEKRSTDWRVLQPIDTIHCGDDFQIEILPRVHILSEIVADKELSKRYSVGKHEAGALLKAIVADMPEGKLFSDCKQENVGIIRYKGVNVPIIVDPGTIAKGENEERWEKRARRYKRNIPAFGEYMRGQPLKERLWGDRQAQLEGFIEKTRAEPHAHYPYEKAQRAHMADLKLEYGHANHVISKAEFDEFCAQREHYGRNPNQTVFARMVQHDALYKTEIGKVIQAGADAHQAAAPESRKGFCHYIEEARQNRNRERE